MDKLTQDAERMEDIACRTADSVGLQYRYIYWMAVAILHILKHIHAKDARLRHEATERDFERFFGKTH